MVRLAGSLPRPVKSVSWSSNSRAPSLDFAVLPWMVIWVTGSGMMMVWSSSVMMSAASRPSSVYPVQSVTVSLAVSSMPMLAGAPNGM